jgi:predicted S18 family serine protease
MLLPPSLAAGVQRTVALAFPAVAVTVAGGWGAVGVPPALDVQLSTGATSEP